MTAWLRVPTLAELVGRGEAAGSQRSGAGWGQPDKPGQVRSPGTGIWAQTFASGRVPAATDTWLPWGPENRPCHYPGA